MKSVFPRRILPACLISAAAVAALAAPGTASASLLTQCEGSSIQGTGSSLQAFAQDNVWNKRFNESKAKNACSGSQGSKSKPTVTYVVSSSGKGYKKWSEPPHEFGTYGYIGTDNTVNASEKSTLEALAAPGKNGVILTIPTLQAAVAVVVNLPANCTATSTPASGRLTLSQATLEGIYAGTVTKWSELKEAGNTLSGTGCEPATTAIKPVVRKDASGTTHIFKRFLNWTDGSKLKTSKGELTWNELSELSNSTVWPEAITPLEGEKSEGLLNVVNANPGSIGYTVLADTRTLGFSPSTGNGPGTSKFWVELESGNKKGKVTYADPATNGDVAAKGDSNCKKTAYTNGSASFPPPSTESTWNEVTAERFSKTYALCGLTYELAIKNYAAYSAFGTTQGQATTVENYLAYSVEKKGGQKEIAGADFLALPTAVAAKANEGVKLIEWTP